jgi:hypothetical protein
MLSPLPRCVYRRILSTSSRRYYCEHPNVNLKSRIVPEFICRSCPVAEGRVSQRFQKFPFAAEESGQRPDLQIVVSHFKEDLGWLSDFSSLDVTVYSKGNPCGPNPLENVGREAETYLYHILLNYDNLSQITVFLQGNPLEHVSNLFEKICSLDLATEYLDLCDHILVEDGNGLPVQPGLPLADFHQKLFNESPPTFFCCRAAACFAVSREAIRSRSREFYEHAHRLVIAEPRGPWSIERLWHRVFRTSSKTEGIVTAADAGFFRELQFLVRSLSGRGHSALCVIDLGLTHDQQAWCLDQPNLLLWTAPDVFASMRGLFEWHWWQAWIKPFCLIHAPFDRMLWIDADCVVLGDLQPLFDEIQARPLFVRDGTAVRTENDDRLYHYLPLGEGAKIAGVNVNSGVVGLCRIRDAEILNAWAWAVQWIAMHGDKRQLVDWADQGLLLWSLLRNRKTSFIEKSLHLNQPMFKQSGLLSGSIAAGRSILEEISSRFPGCVIAHFLGPHKLSRQLDDELQRIFAGEKSGEKTD